MTNPADTRVGFIGLGNMGGPMAANLIAAGYRLTILDLDRTRGQDLEAAGARWSATPREVASVSDLVLTALPGPRDVEAVVLNDIQLPVDRPEFQNSHTKFFSLQFRHTNTK